MSETEMLSLPWTRFQCVRDFFFFRFQKQRQTGLMQMAVRNENSGKKNILRK